MYPSPGCRDGWEPTPEKQRTGRSWLTPPPKQLSTLPTPREPHGCCSIRGLEERPARAQEGGLRKPQGAENFSRKAQRAPHKAGLGRGGAPGPPTYDRGDTDTPRLSFLTMCLVFPWGIRLPRNGRREHVHWALSRRGWGQVTGQVSSIQPLPASCQASNDPPLQQREESGTKRFSLHV